MRRPDRTTQGQPRVVLAVPKRRRETAEPAGGACSPDRSPLRVRPATDTEKAMRDRLCHAA